MNVRKHYTYTHFPEILSLILVVSFGVMIPENAMLFHFTVNTIYKQVESSLSLSVAIYIFWCVYYVPDEEQQLDV